MLKERVYLISPVRDVTPEQATWINRHAESLGNSPDLLIFNPVRDAPQEDRTGFNIVMAELNFLRGIASQGGRVDILWNKGGKPSEGSRVDIAMAFALGLRLNLVKVFNEEEPAGPQATYRIIEEITKAKKGEAKDESAEVKKMKNILQAMAEAGEALIDWDTAMVSEEQEWQRLRLGLALGCLAKIPEFKLRLGKLTGADPPDKKSYPKVVKEIERQQNFSLPSVN